MAPPLPRRDRRRRPRGAGAKAATLARLRRRGFPVPDGFVLPADTALDAAALGAGPRAPAGGPGRAVLLDRRGPRGRELRRPVPDHPGRVRGRRGGARPPRPAATPRAAAAAYARAMGAATGRMAVLVQQPGGARGGRGRLLPPPARPAARAASRRCAAAATDWSSGEVIPDRYELDRATRRAPARGRSDGCLDARRPRARWWASCAASRRRCGSPQDVEWAIGPGALPDALVLLQARPITTGDETAPIRASPDSPAPTSARSFPAPSRP